MSTRSSKRALELIDPNAAGIDLGSTSHFVSINPDKSSEPVREFGCFTCDLQAMGKWLLESGVSTVAMEATGVYWMPVYEMLSQMGLKVRLVDARKVHNVPGRKSDVQDCQWLRELQTYGLLSNCFVPDADTLSLRTYYRQRESITELRSTQIRMMQKALDQMNLHLHKVLSDITGVTGMQIIRAILDGERDPKVLASMRRSGVKRSEEDIIKALQGNVTDHHLFILRQAVELYDRLAQMIKDVDKCIEAELGAWCKRYGKDTPSEALTRSPRKNQPNYNLPEYLYSLTGIDLTRINGLDSQSILAIFSECGLSYTAWPTSKHWTSWLGLAPTNRISGGRRLKSARPCSAGRAGTVFRVAAQSLHHSKCALGAQLRRLASRRGMPSAIKAIARKIATAFYNAMIKGREFVDQGAAAYEKQLAQQQLRRIQKLAGNLGYTLVANSEVATVS